jgi:Na+/H+-dicarboxylate symporter
LMRIVPNTAFHALTKGEILTAVFIAMLFG